MFKSQALALTCVDQRSTKASESKSFSGNCFFHLDCSWSVQQLCNHHGRSTTLAPWPACTRGRTLWRRLDWSLWINLGRCNLIHGKFYGNTFTPALETMQGISNWPWIWDIHGRPHPWKGTNVMAGTARSKGVAGGTSKWSQLSIVHVDFLFQSSNNGNLPQSSCLQVLHPVFGPRGLPSTSQCATWNCFRSSWASHKIDVT